MTVLGTIAMILLVFGGAAVVMRIADEHDRSSLFWGLLSMFGAGFACWAAYRYVLAGAAVDSVGLGKVSLIILLPAGFHVVVAVVIVKLPAAAGRTRASHWPMAWIGRVDRDQDNTCRLEVRPSALTIASETEALRTTIPFDQLTELRADGECVRMRWSCDAEPGEALLRPMGGARTREGRVRLVQAIVRRIESRRGAKIPAARATLRGAESQRGS